MQTGDKFPIFQDREDILVGEQWRVRIRTAIDGATLLVAVITPSYLRSEACREEVSLFAARERSLGRDDLIVPILYVASPGLADQDDEIAQLLSSRQYVDWTTHRFEDPQSNDVRRAIARLAKQIVRALERSQAQGAISIVPDEESTEDEPGFIELLAEAEIAMPLFTEAILSFGRALETVNGMTRAATDELDSASRSGKPSSARLAVIHRFTQQLGEPVSEMEHLTDDYVYQLARVGSGVNALVARIPHLEAEDEVRAAGELLVTLEDLAASGKEGFGSLRGLYESVVANYSISSTLRPVLRRMSNAMLKMLPSEEEFERWRDELAAALQQRSG